MSDATHAFCRKCNDVQPVDWSSFKQVTMAADASRGRVFKGVEAKCAVCAFEIVQLGTAFTEQYR